MEKIKYLQLTEKQFNLLDDIIRTIQDGGYDDLVKNGDNYKLLYQISLQFDSKRDQEFKVRDTEVDM